MTNLTKARIDELVSRAYETACAHGFHEEKLSDEHFLMLAISEVGEAVNADRRRSYANMEAFERYVIKPHSGYDDDTYWCRIFEAYIKDRVADELADVCIRLFDLAGVLNMNILPSQIERGADYFMEENSFCEHAYCLCVILAKWSFHDAVSQGIGYVFRWSEQLGIDLEKHIELKMKYNEMRAYKHGKEY